MDRFVVDSMGHLTLGFFHLESKQVKSIIHLAVI